MSSLKKIEETFWFVGRLASEPEEELSGWLGDCRVKMKKYRENN